MVCTHSYWYTCPHESAPVLPTCGFLGSRCEIIHAYTPTKYLVTISMFTCSPKHKVMSASPVSICVHLCHMSTAFGGPTECLEFPGEQDKGADGRSHCLALQASWVPRMTPLLIPLQALPARTHRPPDVLVSLDADRAQRRLAHPDSVTAAALPPAPFSVPSAALIVPHPC